MSPGSVTVFHSAAPPLSIRHQQRRICIPRRLVEGSGGLSPLQDGRGVNPALSLILCIRTSFQAPFPSLSCSLIGAYVVNDQLGADILPVFFLASRELDRYRSVPQMGGMYAYLCRIQPEKPSDLLCFQLTTDGNHCAPELTAWCPDKVGLTT